MEEEEIIDDKLGDELNSDLDFLLDQEIFDEKQPNQMPIGYFFKGEEKYDFLFDTSKDQSGGSEEIEDGDDNQEEDNQESKNLIQVLT